MQRSRMLRVLGPTRPLPRIGAAARVAHFGGGVEVATITAVRDDGRRLEVRLRDGERLEFELSPATARFVASDRHGGPRLELVD
jgi:hypothetical protein